VNHGSFGRIQFTCSTGSATFAVYTMRKSQWGENEESSNKNKGRSKK
jgi:hypothetical protein